MKQVNRIVLALAALLPLYASAVPVTWTLQDVRVGFSGTSFQQVALTGSFVYDADLDLYSNVNITSQGGNGLQCAYPNVTPCNGFFLRPFAGQHYDLASNVAAVTTPQALVALNSGLVNDGLLGDPLLYLRFASALTNAGGEIRIGDPAAAGSRGGVEFFCPNAACTFDLQTNLFRNVIFDDYIDQQGQLVRYNGRVVANVPEPQTLAMLFLGLLLTGGLVARRRSV